MDTRYAIYFVPPPESPLYRFGASVLGFDTYTGNAVGYPRGADANWSAVVRAPRVYGFHATLKAPFRLVAGTAEHDLVAALDALAGDCPSLDAGPPEIAALDDFVALVPSGASPALATLASTCVRSFDRFRAPMTADERQRRLRAPLSPRQMRQLELWGYPYVDDDFRFHMTLTGPLAVAEREPTVRWLRRCFAEAVAGPRLLMSRLVIARQSDATFRVCHVAELKAAG